MRNNNVTMMSTRVRQAEAKRNFFKKSFKLLLTTAFVLATFFTVNCFAAGDGSEAIKTAQSLLSKAATAGGGLWAVWGLVTLGMAIKDHNGPGIGNAVWQIVGGAIIIAAGVAIGALDISMSTTTTP